MVEPQFYETEPAEIKDQLKKLLAHLHLGQDELRAEIEMGQDQLIALVLSGHTFKADIGRQRCPLPCISQREQRCALLSLP